MVLTTILWNLRFGEHRKNIKGWTCSYRERRALAAYFYSWHNQSPTHKPYLVAEDTQNLSVVVSSTAPSHNAQNPPNWKGNVDYKYHLANNILIWKKNNTVNSLFVFVLIKMWQKLLPLYCHLSMKHRIADYFTNLNVGCQMISTKSYQTAQIVNDYNKHTFVNQGTGKVLKQIFLYVFMTDFEVKKISLQL